jgi:starvation-inducible DNA-binding protein
MVGIKLAKGAGDRVYSTRNTLPAGVRAQVSALLNLRLADAIDLSGQAKQAHWNVKGPHFIALHHLFDTVHAAIEQHVDLLAERVVQLGSVAAGTVRLAAEHSTLAEYPRDAVGGTEHVNALASALADFGARMRETNSAVIGLRDEDTADICTEISRDVDKHLWMVEAHVQSRTNGHGLSASPWRGTGDEVVIAGNAPLESIRADFTPSGDNAGDAAPV